MIDPTNFKYLLDCYPGTVSHYNWLYIRNEKGEPHLYAANWFEESELSAIRKK